MIPLSESVVDEQHSEWKLDFHEKREVSRAYWQINREEFKKEVERKLKKYLTREELLDVLEEFEMNFKNSSWWGTYIHNKKYGGDKWWVVVQIDYHWIFYLSYTIVYNVYRKD
eukprot:TRINITY_DN5698_c0_g1_i1.p1 TRINITY_DN5698_c0_g1~~TRINITY_DN5698_c0_g1_i1.p1  ORF type:complete len:113 (+),score=32.84 TRINITY_DN5698_c0_g1_i1:42-380(+)